MSNILNVTIQHLDYYDPDTGFSICTVIDAIGEPIRAVGNFRERHEYADCRLEGEWETTPHIQQFHFHDYTISPPKDTQRLISYLQIKTKLPKGICKLFAETFHTELFRLIDTSPDQLKRPGIQDEHIQTLCAVFSHQDSYEKSRQLLNNSGIDLSCLKSLHRQLGHDTDLHEALKANPFLLYYHCDDVTLNQAMGVADYFKMKPQDDVSIAAISLFALRNQRRLHGHSCLPIDALINTVNQRMGRDCLDEDRLTALAEGPLKSVVQINDGIIAEEQQANKEAAIAHRLLALKAEADFEAPFATPKNQLQALSDCTDDMVDGLYRLLRHKMSCFHIGAGDSVIRWLDALCNTLDSYHAETLILCPSHSQLQLLNQSLSRPKAMLCQHWTSACRQEIVGEMEDRLELEVIIFPFVNHYSSQEMEAIVMAIPDNTQIVFCACPAGGLHPDDSDWLRDFELLGISTVAGPACPPPTPVHFAGNQDASVTCLSCDWDELYGRIPELYSVHAEKGTTKLVLIHAFYEHEAKTEKLNRLLHYHLCEGLQLEAIDHHDQRFYCGEVVLFSKALYQWDIPLYAEGVVLKVDGGGEGLVVQVGNEEVVIPNEHLDCLIPGFVIPLRWLKHFSCEQVILCVHPQHIDDINDEVLGHLYQSSQRQVLVLGDIAIDQFKSSPTSQSERFTTVYLNQQKTPIKESA